MNSSFRESNATAHLAVGGLFTLAEPKLAQPSREPRAPEGYIPPLETSLGADGKYYIFVPFLRNCGVLYILRADLSHLGELSVHPSSKHAS